MYRPQSIHVGSTLVNQIAAVNHIASFSARQGQVLSHTLLDQCEPSWFQVIPTVTGLTPAQCSNIIAKLAFVPNPPLLCIRLHCPGLGGCLDATQHDVIIANKGACPTYGPSGSMRDEEISSGGTRNTCVAYAPSQNGQAIKAMCRDTYFLERWKLLLTHQGFSEAVIQKLLPADQPRVPTPPVPAHLMQPDCGVQIGMHILLMRFAHIRPRTIHPYCNRIEISGFSAGSYTAAWIATLILGNPALSNMLGIRMVKLGALAFPPNIAGSLVKNPQVYLVHVDTDKLCRVDSGALIKVWTEFNAPAALTLLSTYAAKHFCCGWILS